VHGDFVQLQVALEPFLDLIGDRVRGPTSAWR